MTVGRWMCHAEYVLMLVSGRVQESFSGTTYVLLPPDPASFRRQAKPGDLYVEFDVPSGCLKTTAAGWAKIIGPRSLQGRHAARSGHPVPHMPFARNIRHIATKP
jgi:hypothetical protein